MLDVSKVLVISAHTDDAELGCGGAITRLIETGANVHHAYFSASNNATLKGECSRSNKVLGIPGENILAFDYETRRFQEHRQSILDDLITLREEVKPSLILAPSSSDIHQDHQVIQAESLRAFKTASIWGYEHPWNNLAFTTDVFVALTREHINRKIEALSKYKSQRTRSYFNRDFTLALARTRGLQAGASYAESFELRRLLV